MTVKNWQHLERLSAALQTKLDPGATVEGSRKFPGRRSGVQRQVDASVQGSLGSAQLWIGIDAKHLSNEVDVMDVGAFHDIIDDVGANKGIMITSIGYTPGALTSALAFGIDTCVFRPARDEDWEGFIREIHFKVQLVAIDYEDGAIMKLRTGEELSCPSTTIFVDREGAFVPAPDLVEASVARKLSDWTPGATAVLEFGPGQFVVGDDGDLASITCVPRRSEIDMNESHIASAADFVLMKLLPNAVIDEKRFFEFDELDAIAERFKPAK